MRAGGDIIWRSGRWRLPCRAKDERALPYRADVLLRDTIWRAWVVSRPTRYHYETRGSSSRCSEYPTFDLVHVLVDGEQRSREVAIERVEAR